MTQDQDPFAGTWTLDPGRSVFDPNHRPARATMVFERGADGGYVMTASGIDGKGEAVSERPQRTKPDGKPYPVPDFPGLVTVTTRPDARTLESEVRREDGSVAGGGTMVVSPDGASLTVMNFGFDSQLREFKQQTVWHRA
jgi:hypothetical protein